jgi:hypothetical protein
VAAKKTARKAPKKAVKKAAKRSTAKRSTAKKSTARKAVKKTAKRKSTKKSATYKVPPVPLGGSSRSSVSTISTTPKPAGGSYSPSKSTKTSGNPSSKVLIAVILGIVILAIAVIANGSSNDESTTVTPTPIASESAAPTPSESSTEATSAPLSAHEAPTKIVAQYTSTGATVFWKSPVTAIEGITGYNLELRAGNSTEWKLVATLPATQFSQDITKTGTDSWAQVKVSTVYSDGVVVDGKIFGLPGSWE